MASEPIVVQAARDEESGMSVVSSEDGCGLVIEADHFDDIEVKASLATGDLAEFSPEVAGLAGRRIEVHAGCPWR